MPSFYEKNSYNIDEILYLWHAFGYPKYQDKFPITEQELILSIEPKVKIHDDEHAKNRLIRITKDSINDNVVNSELFEWLNYQDIKTLIYCWHYIVFRMPKYRNSDFFNLSNKTFFIDFDEHCYIRPTQPTEETFTLPIFIKYDLIKTIKYLINTHFLEINKKINFTLSLHAIVLNKIQSKKDTSWIDQNDELQINWIKNYLLKSKLLDTSLSIIMDNDLSLIETCIDLLELKLVPSDKTLFIMKMKKSWSQYKSRAANKFKKNYHLPLTIEAKKQLSKLAELDNKKESDVLIALINKEASARRIEKY
ncbi:hypothetical protein [Acinetobacter haemolyticus]|uniref:Uncharacterized protein n=1 Tax=Acinetobacter haemolyticus TaxID=29430 RepID=A0AAW4JA61_ACIHA|nr:hypothetical protein [Acinetobacter haemolyticus]MBO3659423.1 hypothetical protein [Acinetobacter haemolyticus]